jgi:hypothetical protein
MSREGRPPSPNLAPLRFSGKLTGGGRELLTFLGLSGLAVGAYLTLAQIQNGEFGFPLDDAWIHQVYARNLGTRGEFAFFPGQSSAGSTSPLWALVLSAGYALHLDYRIWTLGLSVVLLALSALLSGKIARRLGASDFAAAWLIPLFSILEWHLTWAAASGMEITLFICLSLALVELGLAASRPFWIGLVAGLLVLTRPEGIVLAALVVLGMFAHAWQSRGKEVGQVGSRAFWQANMKKFMRCSSFFVALSVCLLPYIGFNLWSSGTLLPNTFYAKSQEYSSMLARANFVIRWWTLYRQPLLGAQILFLPGLVWIGSKLIFRREWRMLVPLVWVGVLPALYAARLPVDYQFGRYEMPIIPFIGVYGIAGTERLLTRIPMRILRRTWGLTIVVLVLVFAWLGAVQYSRSAAIVNCEMVATARWTAANLPEGVLIAAHDIGAQGYYDSHPILDLAGLVSPEVIPIIRDEGRLREWIEGRGASYAIFFPTWYPDLASKAGFIPIHSENCEVTHLEGEEDLKVYRVPKSSR